MLRKPNILSSTIGVKKELVVINQLTDSGFWSNQLIKDSTKLALSVSLFNFHPHIFHTFYIFLTCSLEERLEEEKMNSIN